MKIGKKIKKYRLAEGLTQTKLGEILNVTPGRISKWENNAIVPSDEELQKLCKALKIDKSDIVPEKVKEAKTPEGPKKVGLSPTKQSYLKSISYAIEIITKIVRILVYVGLGALIVCILCIPMFFSAFDINGHTITVKGLDEKIELINEGETSYIVKMGEDERLVDLEISTKKIDDVLNNYSKTRVMCIAEISCIISGVTLLLLSYILFSIEHIAKNVYNGEAFTMENASSLRNIGYLMIAVIVVPFLSGIVPNAILDTNFGENIGYANIVEILIVFALSYICEYGSILASKTDITLYDK